LVHGLLEAGHHVTVIAGAHGRISETVSHALLEIQRVPLGHSNWIGFAFRSAQVLKKLENTRSFDIVHFWDLHFAYAYAGRYIATLHQSFRQRSKALRFTNAGLPSQLYHSTYYLFARILAENWSARRAHGLMSVSATTRDEFIRNYGIPTEKIALTRHGIDTRFFHRMHATDFLRSQLKLNPGEPILFFAGFVTPRRDWIISHRHCLRFNLLQS
jgi:glycosyltransferase involved in cell wall biosynthesis